MVGGYGHRPPCPLIPDAPRPRHLLAGAVGAAGGGGWFGVWPGGASRA